MKYTKQQEVMKNAGMTLCVECPNGCNGDRTCQIEKLPKNSTNGCFKAGSFSAEGGENDTKNN